jgi:hypothetical protein
VKVKGDKGQNLKIPWRRTTPRFRDEIALEVRIGKRPRPEFYFRLLRAERPGLIGGAAPEDPQEGNKEQAAETPPNALNHSSALEERSD